MAERQRTMAKKKKAAVIMSVVLSILILTAAGGFLWYADSPFPTAVKFLSAVRNGDTDAMLDCVEPSVAAGMRRITAYFEPATRDRMAQYSSGRSGGLAGNSTLRIRPAAYHRNGNTASWDFRITNSETDSTNIFSIRFIRLNGIWYLKLSD